MSMSTVEMERALKQLRLSGVKATLETRVLQSNQSGLSFMETFSLLIQDELDRRRTKMIERRYKLSGLDERKTMEEFDWSYNPKLPKKACFELMTLKFIAESGDPLLIGSPGTGKSHIAKSIALSAVLGGYSVIFGEAEELLSKIVLEKEPTRKKLLHQSYDCDLLFIDDLFLHRKLHEDLAGVLQQILHKRYKLGRSTLITSNRVISDWGSFLGDNAMATTLLDRLMHRGIPLEFKGKSYRLKEAAARLAKGQSSE
jgi:DNA replication protein DnaC